MRDQDCEKLEYMAHTEIENADPPNDTPLPKLTQALLLPSNCRAWPLYVTPLPAVIRYGDDELPTSLKVDPTAVPTE
jgi:hypothetical protein